MEVQSVEDGEVNFWNIEKFSKNTYGIMRRSQSCSFIANQLMSSKFGEIISEIQSTGVGGNFIKNANKTFSGRWEKDISSFMMVRRIVVWNWGNQFQVSEPRKGRGDCLETIYKYSHMWLIRTIAGHTDR